MWKIISDIFFPTEYMPHGYCFLWQPYLVWLHVVSDVLITLAYYSIPAFLIYFVRNRKDVPFPTIFILFGAFIISCGTTHILEVWTLWHPSYWVLGGVKLFTALVSLYTVVEIIPIIPKALSLPSPAELEALNQELMVQIGEREDTEKELRKLYTQLEQRVVERTLDLELVNLQLQESKYFAEKITDLIPNIIYLFDLKEQKNVFCNSFITEILGYSPQDIQLMGTNLLDQLIHPEDLAKTKQHFENCLNLKDDELSEIEYRIKDTKGQWRWLISRDTVFERNGEGKPLQTIGIAYETTDRKQGELELKSLNLELASQVHELEARNFEMIKLGEINDYLQACLTIKEAETALSDLLKPLFPDCAGSVFMLKSSKNLLETVATWGESGVTHNILLPSECWGIRRGVAHKAESTTPSLLCQHIESQPSSGATYCNPLSAQGETLGLLHLYFKEAEQLTPSKERLAQTVCQQLALSFANLKLQQTLKDQSLIDPLTGLYNRRHLQQSLIGEIGYCLRKEQPLGLIMLDIDHFKRFNDLHGHQAGDLVLREIAQYISKNIRTYDIACRYGGEEFAIIMPGSPTENTLNRAEQIREGIKKLNIQVDDNYLGNVTASFGISSFPGHGEDSNTLLMIADQALYEAKKQGRDRVILAP